MGAQQKGGASEMVDQFSLLETKCITNICPYTGKASMELLKEEIVKSIFKKVPKGVDKRFIHCNIPYFVVS